jgi:hypothetical protein
MEKDASVNVELTHHLIPLAVDGYRNEITIKDRSINTAISTGIAKDPFIRGFKLVDHFKMAVTIKETGEKIDTTQTCNVSKEYRFAEKIIDRNTFSQLTDQEISPRDKQWLLDVTEKDSLIYKYGRAYLHLTGKDKENTILITKEGGLLWPKTITPSQTLKNSGL